MLCLHCLKIFDGNLIDPDWTTETLVPNMKNGVHHSRSAMFEDAVQQGCHLCTSLFHCIPPAARGDLKRLDHEGGGWGFSMFSLYKNANEDKLTLEVRLPKAELREVKLDEKWRGIRWGYYWHLYAVPAADDPRIKYNEDIQSSSGSNTTLGLVKRWVDRCVSSHTKCREARQASETPYYPTRIIDVGTTEEPQLRLRISSEDFMEGRYVTLSHCWGKLPIKTLTMSNEKTMRSSISLDELPLTFRDAIQVTRTLQVRYIWIDSLCIIQDSPEDWVQEAPTMVDVYTNSLCNIAATKSSNASEGLFVRRNPLTFNPFVSFARLKDKSGKYQGYFRKDTTYWSSRIDMAPLLSRAWVVQERILAPRIVHFGFDQVLWECSEEVASEEYPMGIPFPESKVQEIFVPQHLPSSTVTDSDRSDRTGHLETWEKIVQYYSQGALTQRSDKLVAISGIAKRMQRLLGSEYLAGLWKFSAVTGLLWTIDKWSTSKRSPIYRAPSWSWASIDGEVLYFDKKRVPISQYLNASEGWDAWNHVEEMIKLIEYSVTPIARDPFIGLKWGYLRFSGRLHSISVEYTAGSTDIVFISDAGRAPRGNTNWVIPDELPPVPFGYDCIRMDLYILPVIRSDEGDVQGLALVPAAGLPQGYYTRFGFFQTNQTNHRRTPDKTSESKNLLNAPQNEKWYEASKEQDFVFCIV